MEKTSNRKNAERDKMSNGKIAEWDKTSNEKMLTTFRYIKSGQSNFEFEYLGEFGTEFENILVYETGAQVGSIYEKNQRSKISCYCPFKPLRTY
jgi:hypothetical protein